MAMTVKWKFRRVGGCPGDSVVKNLPTSAGDSGSIPGLGGAHVLGAAESIHGS